MVYKKIFVAVMGVTGAGKSTFIRAASSLDTIPVGHGLTSCVLLDCPCNERGSLRILGTTNVTPYSFMYEGFEVILIDTPGFDDTFKSEADVLKEIASWLEKTYRDPAHIKLSGVIYMHALDDRKMSGSSLRNLKMFRQLCGDQSMQNVIMVTSGWDKMIKSGDEDLALQKEDELITTGEFWATMLGRGARTDRFMFTQESALSIIAKVIPDTPVVLQIQQELVEDNKALVETAAGATVNEELIKLQQNYEKKIREVQQDMVDALKDRDEEIRRFCEEEQARYERMRDDARRAQDSLLYDQRNSRRRYDQELDDLREALARCTTTASKGQKQDQQKLIVRQAQSVADNMEFDEVVHQMRAHIPQLRREEREAVEQEILLAESAQHNDDVNSVDEDIKAKKQKRARRKKRAFKLCLNVVGVVGSVTMSALGLGFLNPFSGLM